MDGRRAVLFGIVIAALGALVWWVARPNALDAVASEAPDVRGLDETHERESLASETPASPDTTTAPTAHAKDERATDATDLSEPGQATRATIRGRIVGVDGLPIAGAIAYALHAPDLGTPYSAERVFGSRLPLDAPRPDALFADVAVVATSDAHGDLALANVPPGRVRLLVTHRDHVRFERDDLRVAAGGVLDLRDVPLEHGYVVKPRVRVDGDVAQRAELVERDRFADAGVAPIVATTRGALAIADERGLLAPPPFALGLHEVVVRDPNSGASLEFTIDPRETPPELVDLGGRERIFVWTPRPPPAALPRVVRALAADAPSAPLPFELRADGRTAAIDSAGRAELVALDARVAYELRPSNARDDWNDLSPWNPPAIVRGDARRVVLEFAPDATIEMPVASLPKTDAASGGRITLEGALPRVLLAIEDGALVHSMRVDSTMLPRFVGIRPRAGASRAILRVESAAYAPYETEVLLESGKTTALDPFVLRAWPRAELTIVDATTKKPIAGARVTARLGVPVTTDALDVETDGPATATTDARGHASIATWGIANTTFEVAAAGRARTTFSGFAPAKESGAPVELELALTRGVRVRVRVVDEDGSAIGAVRVEYHDATWTPSSARARPDPERDRAKRWDLELRADGDRAAFTDAGGYATFPHVAAGRHAFHVQRYGRLLESEWTVREIAGDVDVVLSSVRRVRCDATLVAGKPLAFARTALVAMPEDSLALLDPRVSLPPAIQARANGAGRATFDELYPGAHLLCAEVEGQTWRALVPVELGRTPKPFAVDLELERIAGVVVDEHRDPVRGAAVLARVRADDSDARANEPDARAVLSAMFGAVDPRPFERVTRTDADGRFRIVGVPSRVDVELIASTDGWHASKRALAVRTREAPAAELELVLETRGALDVVLAPGTTPRSGWLVAVPAEHVESIRSTAVGAVGRTTLSALSPGDWLLYLVAMPSGLGTSSVRPAFDARVLEALLARGATEELADALPSERVNVVAGETQRVVLQWP